MNNLNKIIDTINENASKESDKLRRQTDEQIAVLEEDTANRIRDMRQKNAAKCDREREMILRRSQGSSDMRRREIMLAARVGLLDKAYSDAEKFILGMDRDAYSALLSNLLADALCDRLAEDRALAEYGETVEKAEFEVAFNADEQNTIGKEVISDAIALLKERGEKAPKVKLASDTVKIGGGFILRSGDVACDCSIHTLIASSREKTEAQTAQVLFS